MRWRVGWRWYVVVILGPAAFSLSVAGLYALLPGGSFSAALPPTLSEEPLVLIGWGSGPYISEFSHVGELLFDARFPPDGESYRAFRFPWSGYPDDDPTVALEEGPNDKFKLYASWNGATEVATWEVLTGPRPSRLESVGSVPRDGFETAMLVQSSHSYGAVRAKDRFGRVLGTSAPMEV